MPISGGVLRVWPVVLGCRLRGLFCRACACVWQAAKHCQTVYPLSLRLKPPLYYDILSTAIKKIELCDTLRDNYCTVTAAVTTPTHRSLPQHHTTQQQWCPVKLSSSGWSVPCPLPSRSLPNVRVRVSESWASVWFSSVSLLVVDCLHLFCWYCTIVCVLFWCCLELEKEQVIGTRSIVAVSKEASVHNYHALESLSWKWLLYHIAP